MTANKRMEFARTVRPTHKVLRTLFAAALGRTRHPTPAGVFRNVFRTKHHAIKVPRLRYLSDGMRCNRWEREMWRKWGRIFGWENLCPVIFADPLGFVVVMPRAEQSVTFQDVMAATSGEYDYYPDITAETKPEDFGRLGNRVVALDYGLPDSDMVSDRRAYYESKRSDFGTANKGIEKTT